MMGKSPVPHIYPKKWVKVERYCELVGEAVGAVRTRRRRGKWLDGKHTKVRDGHLYVNLIEADKWVESDC